MVIDRKLNKNADIGRFELMYRSIQVQAPNYFGIDLKVEGTGLQTNSNNCQNTNKTQTKPVPISLTHAPSTSTSANSSNTKSTSPHDSHSHNLTTSNSAKGTSVQIYDMQLPDLGKTSKTNKVSLRLRKESTLPAIAPSTLEPETITTTTPIQKPKQQQQQQSQVDVTKSIKIASTKTFSSSTISTNASLQIQHPNIKLNNQYNPNGLKGKQTNIVLSSQKEREKYSSLILNQNNNKKDIVNLNLLQVTDLNEDILCSTLSSTSSKKPSSNLPTLNSSIPTNSPQNTTNYLIIKLKNGIKKAKKSQTVFDFNEYNRLRQLNKVAIPINSKNQMYIYDTLNICTINNRVS